MLEAIIFLWGSVLILIGIYFLGFLMLLGFEFLRDVFK